MSSAVELNGCFSSAYPLPEPVPPTNWTPALTPGEVGGEQRYRQHSGPGKFGAPGGFGALSYCENIPYQDLNIVRRMGAHFLDFLPRAPANLSASPSDCPRGGVHAAGQHVRQALLPRRRAVRCPSGAERRL